MNKLYIGIGAGIYLIFQIGFVGALTVGVVFLVSITALEVGKKRFLANMKKNITPTKDNQIVVR